VITTLANIPARQCSITATLIPNWSETSTTGELSGGGKRATTRSLNC
jgi:hypothetical protein